jgi:hypothetical protein
MHRRCHICMHHDREGRRFMGPAESGSCRLMFTNCVCFLDKLINTGSLRDTGRGFGDVA